MIEIGLHVVACGSAYFTHSRFGTLHTIDCLIVIVSFGLELYLAVSHAPVTRLDRTPLTRVSYQMQGAEARVASLLTILRIWRVIKLVSSAETGLEDYSDLNSRGAREGGLAKGTSCAASRGGSLAWQE